MRTKEVYLNDKLFVVYEDGRIYNPKTARFVGSKVTNGVGATRYSRFNVSTKNKMVTFYVHRVVAEAFVTGWFDGATVDHIDGDRSNNHYTNLVWITQGENSRKFMKEAWETGKLNGQGGRRGAKKVKWNGVVYNSVSELSRAIDRQQSSVSYAIKHGTKTNGYHPEFV